MEQADLQAKFNFEQAAIQATEDHAAKRRRDDAQEAASKRADQLKSEKMDHDAETGKSLVRLLLGQQGVQAAQTHSITTQALAAIGKLDTAEIPRTHQESMEMERLLQEGCKRKYEHEMEMEKLRQEDRKHERQHAMDMEQLKQGVALEKDQVTK